jgi:hypothetical protein
MDISDVMLDGRCVRVRRQMWLWLSKMSLGKSTKVAENDFTHLGLICM